MKRNAVYGEFWLINGQAAGADGDIGDVNHASMVQQDLLAELVEDVNSETGLKLNPEFTDYDTLYRKIKQYLETNNLEDEVETFILDTIGFDKDKLDVITDRVDPRDYGLEHLGWKRMKGTSIQTWTLTPGDLKEIANGVWDAYGEEAESETYEIEVSSTGKLYTGVPWEVLSSENVAALREYEHHYASSKKKASLFRDLDFLAKR